MTACASCMRFLIVSSADCADLLCTTARATVVIAISPIDVIATLLARWELNEMTYNVSSVTLNPTHSLTPNRSRDSQSRELTSLISMDKWNGVTGMLMVMFWWNKLGYINLANRRPKTITYGRKNLGFGDGWIWGKTVVLMSVSESVATLNILHTYSF